MNELIDGLFFVGFYSNIPLYINMRLPPITGHFLIIESSLEPTLRYFFWNFLATCFFLFIHFTELRQKYMFWHLQKRRRFSGFIPLEMCLATCYHTFYLCFLTEVAITFVDGSFMKHYSSYWVTTTTHRITNMFFTSFFMHLLLEISGYNDTARLNYYQR